MAFEHEDVVSVSSSLSYRIQRCVLRSEHHIDMVWHQPYNFRNDETHLKTVYLT